MSGFPDHVLWSGPDARLGDPVLESRMTGPPRSHLVNPPPSHLVDRERLPSQVDGRLQALESQVRDLSSRLERLESWRAAQTWPARWARWGGWVQRQILRLRDQVYEVFRG